MKELIVPAVAQEERTNDAAGWTKLGTELAGYQKKLAAHGIDLAWHNHAFEFAKLPDGSYPLDHIFAAAPGLHWQADIGWIAWAGEDPVAWIKKYADRVTALHVKDLAPKGENAEEDGQADVGHGVLDWKNADAGDQGAGREVSRDGARQPERLRALRPPVVPNRIRLVEEAPLDEIGVGIIGCGNISSIYLTNLPHSPGVKVRGGRGHAAEVAAAQGKRVRRRGDAASMRCLQRDDIDIVVNLTVPAAHGDRLARRALRRQARLLREAARGRRRAWAQGDGRGRMAGADGRLRPRHLPRRRRHG